MGSSIQEFLKKINSRLSFADCVSLVVTAIFFVVFAYILAKKTEKDILPITYIRGNQTKEQRDIRPMGSKNGTTYTFSWCQGASAIKPSNIVYFRNEEEAKRSGRTLSKLCVK